MLHTKGLKKVFKVLTMLIMCIFTCSVEAYPTTPPVPGSLCFASNKDFDGYRYAELISHCKRAVSSSRKDKICKRDGVWPRTEDYTVDHIIPLALGGSNKDDNLWCQHKSLNVTRQEFQEYVKLKNGETTQIKAILTILSLKFKE